MSQLPTTLLETHPTGTLNPGGIVNGNWEQLENIFANFGSGAGILATAMDLAGTGSTTLVTLTGVQTLTNKTLTTPTVTGGTFTSPILVTPALGTPASGNLSSCTADGTNAVAAKNWPQRVISGDVTLNAADAGGHVYHPAADTTARVVTIPDNSVTPYPIGTHIHFAQDAGAGTLTIQTGADTLVEPPAGTTDQATLTGWSWATLLKVGTTKWVIHGGNLS